MGDGTVRAVGLRSIIHDAYVVHDVDDQLAQGPPVHVRHRLEELVSFVEPRRDVDPVHETGLGGQRARCRDDRKVLPQYLRAAHPTESGQEIGLDVVTNCVEPFGGRALPIVLDNTLDGRDDLPVPFREAEPRIPVQSVHGHSGGVEFGYERAQALSIPRDRPLSIDSLRLIRELHEQIGDTLGAAKLDETHEHVPPTRDGWSVPEPHRSPQRSARFLGAPGCRYFGVALCREGDVLHEYPPRSFPVRQEDEAGQLSCVQ